MKTFLFTPEKITGLKGEKETFTKNLLSLQKFVMQIPSECKNILLKKKSDQQSSEIKKSCIFIYYSLF